MKLNTENQEIELKLKEDKELSTIIEEPSNLSSFLKQNFSKTYIIKKPKLGHKLKVLYEKQLKFVFNFNPFSSKIEFFDLESPLEKSAYKIFKPSRFSSTRMISDNCNNECLLKSYSFKEKFELILNNGITYFWKRKILELDFYLKDMNNKVVAKLSYNISGSKFSLELLHEDLVVYLPWVISSACCIAHLCDPKI